MRASRSDIVAERGLSRTHGRSTGAGYGLGVDMPLPESPTTVTPTSGAFGDRLAGAIARFGPLCVGLDPAPSLLEDFGLSDDPSGLAAFVEIALEALAGVVPVVKPQVAYFERHGAAGYRVLEELVGAARRAGLLVLADAKRGDIPETSEAYAAAWLAPESPLAVDALTATPYVGPEALTPFIRRAGEAGRGVFVVASTSNPEGRPLQAARMTDGASVAQYVVRFVAAHNRSRPDLGVVVGLPVEHELLDELSDLGGPILVPGLGAQGGTTEQLRKAFGALPPGRVLPTAARSVLRAGPRVPALRAQAERLVADLAAALC